LAAYHFEHFEKGPFPKDRMILLAKDPSPIVARTMIAKLAEVPDQWAFDTLVELTESTNMEIRCFAIDWLGGTKQKELARAILEKLLLNDNPQVRKAAKSGLENLKSENI
jgi:HEAT repeat protein